MKRLLASAMLALAISPVMKAESAPCFPGGMSNLMIYISENLQYPPEAIENSIEGKVLVRFKVLTDGSIAEPEILRPIDPFLEAEALRIVTNMPQWLPATDEAGTPKIDHVTLPISFKITES